MVCGKEIGNIYGFRMGPINRQKNDPECRGGGGGADLNVKQASGQAGRQTGENGGIASQSTIIIKAAAKNKNECGAFVAQRHTRRREGGMQPHDARYRYAHSYPYRAIGAIALPALCPTCKESSD